MTDPAQPTCGRMPWSAALAGPLAGTTCLWQDLDGLHVAAPPEQPPPTSHLWGWTDGGRMVRLRLDGGTAYVAVCEPTPGERTEPWPRDYGRVQAAARHPTGGSHVGTRYLQVIVDGITDGVQPVTFIRPADAR
jgi:hypothetical protein